MTVHFYSKLLLAAALLCTFTLAQSQTAPGDLSEEAAALRALIEEYEKNGGKVSTDFDEPASTPKPAAAAPAAPKVSPAPTPAPAPKSTPMPTFTPREIKSDFPMPKISTPPAPAPPKPEIKKAVEEVKTTAADTMKIERPSFTPRASSSVVIQDTPPAPAPTPQPAPTIKKQVRDTSSIILNDAAASGTAAVEKKVQPKVDTMKEAVKPVVTETTAPEIKPAPAIAERKPAASKPKPAPKKKSSTSQPAVAQTGAVFKKSNPAKPKTQEEIEKEESTPIASARQIGSSNTGASGFFSALNRSAQRKGNIFKGSRSTAGEQSDTGEAAPATSTERSSGGGLFSGLGRGGNESKSSSSNESVGRVKR